MTAVNPAAVEWSPEELTGITRALQLLNCALVLNGVPLGQAAAAALMLAASLSVQTDSTDDEIVAEFRKTLLDHRTEGATKQ